MIFQFPPRVFSINLGVITLLTLLTTTAFAGEGRWHFGSNYQGQVITLQQISDTRFSIRHREQGGASYPSAEWIKLVNLKFTCYPKFEDEVSFVRASFVVDLYSDKFDLTRNDALKKGDVLSLRISNSSGDYGGLHGIASSGDIERELVGARDFFQFSESEMDIKIKLTSRKDAGFSGDRYIFETFSNKSLLSDDAETSERAFRQNFMAVTNALMQILGVTQSTSEVFVDFSLSAGDYGGRGIGVSTISLPEADVEEFVRRCSLNLEKPMVIGGMKHEVNGSKITFRGDLQ